MSAPQYGPTINPGDVRRRAWRIGAENPLGGLPTITFHEEEIIKLSDGSERPLGRTRDLSVAYAPGTSLPLLNPITGEPTGQTISHDVVFAALYSLGRATQDATDAAVAAVAAAVEARVAATEAQAAAVVAASAAALAAAEAQAAAAAEAQAAAAAAAEVAAAAAALVAAAAEAAAAEAAAAEAAAVAAAAEAAP